MFYYPQAHLIVYIFDRYYKSDIDVKKDFELQNLLNELSAEGKRLPDGGKGKVSKKVSIP